MNIFMMSWLNSQHQYHSDCIKLKLRIIYRKTHIKYINVLQLSYHIIGQQFLIEYQFLLLTIPTTFFFFSFAILVLPHTHKCLILFKVRFYMGNERVPIASRFFRPIETKESGPLSIYGSLTIQIHGHFVCFNFRS